MSLADQPKNVSAAAVDTHVPPAVRWQALPADDDGVLVVSTHTSPCPQLQAEPKHTGPPQVVASLC
jgi:hypothetical protein